MKPKKERRPSTIRLSLLKMRFVTLHWEEKAIYGVRNEERRAQGMRQRLSYDPEVATATAPSSQFEAGASKASLSEVQLYK